MTAVFVAFAVVSGGLESKSAQWNFEDSSVGKLPSGWSAMKTGKGPGSVWKVLEDKSASTGPKVLAQSSSEGPSSLFNLCVLGEVKRQDVDLQVAFKAVSGKIDQGGGPVWRLQDADNYYIARMNPLEGNFRVYKVVNGKRTQLGSADVDGDAGRWHTIRIVHNGKRIQCYFNGKLHLDVEDDAFPAAGQVGVWTKADAVTYFDDLIIGKSAE